MCMRGHMRDVRAAGLQEEMNEVAMVREARASLGALLGRYSRDGVAQNNASASAHQPLRSCARYLEDVDKALDDHADVCPPARPPARPNRTHFVSQRSLTLLAAKLLKLRFLLKLLFLLAASVPRQRRGYDCSLQAVHDGAAHSKLKEIVTPYHNRFARSLTIMMNKVLPYTICRTASVTNPVHRRRPATAATLLHALTH